MLVVLALVLGLSACGPVLTTAAVQQTAVVRGCWPDSPVRPTPAPVTVTPLGAPTPLPVGFRWPTGVPTPTRLPTTTAIPRCPPAPGTPAAVWPTPLPPPPPYPTMPATRAGGGRGQAVLLHLPEIVLSLDLATHPTEGWPVVGAVVWSGTDNPDRAFVSVRDPATQTWTPAQQVDRGPAGLGRYTRTLEVAVSGDGAVHAVWGMSDPDFSDNDPPSGVWAAVSHDRGHTWGAPERIGRDCRQVIDLAATTDGWVVAGLGCHDGPQRVQPAIAVRDPAGTWTLTRLPGAIWIFTEGVVALAEEPSGTLASVLFLTGPDGVMTTPPEAVLFQTQLGTGAPWQPQVIAFAIPDHPPGPRLWHARALVYTRPGSVTPLVTVLVTDADRWAAYALTSQDGGRSWLPPELVVAPPAPEARIAFVAPAYDVRQDRLAALYTCCVEGGWSADAPSTHALRWSVPGSGVWADPTPGQAVPLILGARAASDLATAQARQAPTVWVAWIEGGSRVQVQALDLATVFAAEGGAP